MPEGHSIHRYARLHGDTLAGKIVRVESPQGRFAHGAARIDQTVLDDVEAHGKHLFYRWDNGETLHVHLGLFGRFRTHRRDTPPPTPGTRLTMRTPEAAVYLSGPTACELISPEEEDTIRSRLGPDPLDSRAKSDEFAERLGRRSIPIGAALLNQQVIAGIGNVYRAEILLLAGISPHRPANQISASETDEIWGLAREQLRQGERTGRIITVEPADVGVARRVDIPRRERLFVYKRDGLPCRRCNESIRMGESANRKIWWCPTCQPA